MLALLRDARDRLEEAKRYREDRVLEALTLLTQDRIGDALGIKRQSVADIRKRALERRADRGGPVDE